MQASPKINKNNPYVNNLWKTCLECVKPIKLDYLKNKGYIYNI